MGIKDLITNITQGGKHSADKDSGVAPSIVRLITSACDATEPLSVSIKDSQHSYRSMFLGMDSGDGFFIDALGTKAGDNRFVPGESIVTIIFQIHNVLYQFESLFTSMDTYQKYPALRLKLPTEIKEEQRREFFRVEPTVNDPVVISDMQKIDEPPDAIVSPELETAHAINISLGGLAFRSSRPMDSETEVRMDLRFPMEDDLLEIDFKVIRSDQQSTTNAFKYAKAKPYIICGRFINSDTAKLKMIQKYILERQRQLLKLSR